VIFKVQVVCSYKEGPVNSRRGNTLGYKSYVKTVGIGGILIAPFPLPLFV
jgi:hypothetical protein